MKMKSVGVVSLAGLLAACGPTPEPPEPGGTGEAVTLQLISEQQSDACKVNLRATYPRDVAAHQRFHSIERPGKSLSRSEGPITVPRPSNDPREVENADGSISFDFYNWTNGGMCSDQEYRLKIGDCQSGDCPPMIFRPDPGPGKPRVTLL